MHSVEHTPSKKPRQSIYLFVNIRFLSYNLILRLFNIPRLCVRLLINETVNCQGFTGLEPSDSKYSVEESEITNEGCVEEKEEGSGALLNMINLKVYICIIFMDILTLCSRIFLNFSTLCI